MIFTHWLRQTFGSQTPVARSPRRGKSSPPSRLRFVPRLDSMEDRLAPALLTVTSLADSGVGSLRAAIVDSVNHTGGGTGDDTIRFASGIDGGTISLSTVGDGTAGPSAFGISNSDTLVIDGQTGLARGMTIERSSSATPFRLFSVNTTGDLTLKCLTVRGFIAKGFNGGGGDNGPGGGGAGLGGAIFNQGTLSLLDVTLTGNAAQGGNGGAYGAFGPGSGGGGMGSAGGNGSGFAGPGAGGGGPNGGGASSFNSTGGGAGGFGGGGGGGYAAAIPYVFGSYPVVGRGGDGGFGGGGGAGGSTSSVGQETSSIDGNDGGNGGFGGGGGAPGFDDVGRDPSRGGYGGGWGRAEDGHPGDAGGGAGMGGGVFNEAGTVTITNSTLAGNTAKGGSGTDGTSWNAGSGHGGGIFNHNGSLAVTNSTLSGNTADQGGRGIYTFGDGAAAPALLKNNIIGQGDTKVSDFAIDYRNGGTTKIGGSENNLIRTTSVLGSTYNVLNSMTADPALGALQDNGGLTPTMKPRSGSPVIDAGSNAALPAGVTTDQRGVARIVNGTVDIGAVEIGLPQTISFAAVNDRTFGDADFQISASATSNLPVSFTAGGAVSVYQIAGVWYAHITGVGSATITATQAGSTEYEAANAVSQSFQIAKAASVTTTVGAGPFTYNGTAQVGGSGTVTGAGGLNTSATSLAYSANADGTGVADTTNAGTYYVTASYAGDANHTASVGAAVAIVINKANATVTVSGYTGVYDAAYHGATGSASGLGGESAGTLDLGATFRNVPGGTANWVFTGNRNYKDQSGQVAINILARHITGGFTAADKVYDGNVAATVLTRSLTGVLGVDAVSLTGGTATFASKNAGTWTVTLTGATLTGGSAGNYALDSVATTTATISRKILAGSATTQSALNVAKDGTVSFRIDLDKSGIVDGQSVAQLFDGASFRLVVGGRTYSVQAQATVVGGSIHVSFRMSDELKAILAANTTATNASNAPAVGLKLEAVSNDGNYTLKVLASTRLFNTAK